MGFSSRGVAEIALESASFSPTLCCRHRSLPPTGPNQQDNTDPLLIIPSPIQQEYVTRADANGTSKISYEEFQTVVKEHEKKPMVCSVALVDNNR